MAFNAGRFIGPGIPLRIEPIERIGLKGAPRPSSPRYRSFFLSQGQVAAHVQSRLAPDLYPFPHVPALEVPFPGRKLHGRQFRLAGLPEKTASVKASTW